MNKRIAVISYHACPLSDEEGIEKGGLNVYVLELSKELAKKGFKIDIFTRSENSDNKKIIEVSSNLRVIHLQAGEQKKISKKKLINYIPQFLESFYTFINSENLNYDLVSAHYYLSGLIGINIKKKLKLPLVVTFHTLALMKNLVAREEEKEDIKRIEAEVLLTKTADKIIATSEKDKEYIHTLYNCSVGKIFVLIPGVDFDLFKPVEKKKAKKIIGADIAHKIILFVGRIEPLKGLDVLFYAIKIIMEKYPMLSFCLWVVGGENINNTSKWSNELKRLEKIKNLLGISTFVKFVGMKQQTELPYYYNASEFVVMPSQYESFGIIALEAMACAVPVIATDATGISDLFDRKHGSLITSSGNPSLLSQKIINLLTDKKEHDKLSLEVLNNVKDLSWERVANKFVEIIRKY